MSSQSERSNKIPCSVKVYPLLRPFAFLYGLGVRLRNWAFDCGLLHSQAYDIPVIGVGNIAVGGTGKTPHVEYILRLLSASCRVAVVSRGYRRKSRGQQLQLSGASSSDAAGAMSIAERLGDEPAQIVGKFPHVTVVADADRRRAISTLLTLSGDIRPDVVVLDDAFQHRYVTPCLQIMLADYARLPYSDLLLPAGRLREPFSGRRRADVVIVTKCPPQLTEQERDAVAQAMQLAPGQPLLFTHQQYGHPYPLFPESDPWPTAPAPLLLVTGIAAPRSLVEYLEPQASSVEHVAFADHHAFTPADIERLNARFAALGPQAFAITTEKDAVRLRTMTTLSSALRRRLYVQPIEVAFLGDGQAEFDSMILRAVHGDGYTQSNEDNP